MIMHRKLLHLRTKKFLNKSCSNCSRSHTSEQMDGQMKEIGRDRTNERNRTRQKKPFHQVFPGMMVPFVAPYFLNSAKWGKTTTGPSFISYRDTRDEDHMALDENW